MVTTVAASNTLRYSNDPSISSPTPWTWYKTQIINITSDITGTIRVTCNIGGNDGCYASPDGCVSIQITKNGTYVWSASPPDMTSSVDSGPISITLLTNDKLELWVLETDCGGTVGCNFLASTAYFRVYYDPAGSASFTSNPSGAQIWVDGSNTGLTTPNTVTLLAPGTHNYTLKLTGYTDATGSFSVTSGSTTTVPTVTLTPATGNGSFTSNPSGATIWIDGINKGVTTPNTITGLSAGSHNYTLKFTGYANATGSFSVTAGSTTTVPTVTFAPSAYFTTTPSGASIYIDNVLQGVTTPATITNLSVGSHSYRLYLAGYNVLLGNFTATGGQTTNLSTILFGTAMAFLSAGD